METVVLKDLKDRYAIVPALYARYIDDIIIGPFDKGSDFSKLLKTFNSISSEIKFTMEVPENGVLNFLDLSIFIENENIHYNWFEKPYHSGTALRKDSYVPSHVKSNYLKNTVEYVQKRCSSEAAFENSKNKLDKKFRQNGYKTYRTFRNRKNKSVHKKRNPNILKMKYINDKTSCKIRTLIKKYDLPVNLVDIPNSNLYSSLQNKPKHNKHENCTVCDWLPSKYTCKDKFFVYKFTCKFCANFYIGQSSRPFKLRFMEHARSFNNKISSALADHRSQCKHIVSIDNFTLDILDKCKNPVDTRLSEARCIKSMKPNINRKHELIDF